MFQGRTPGSDRLFLDRSALLVFSLDWPLNSKKNYKEAIQYYNEALAGEEPSKKHLLVSNRSACHFQLKDYDKALEDARLCIQLKQDWAKVCDTRIAQASQSHRHIVRNETYTQACSLTRCYSGSSSRFSLFTSIFRYLQSSTRQQ